MRVTERQELNRFSQPKKREEKKIRHLSCFEVCEFSLFAQHPKQELVKLFFERGAEVKHN